MKPAESAVLGFAVAGAGDAPVRVIAQLVPTAGGGTGGVHVAAVQLDSGGDGRKEFLNGSSSVPRNSSQASRCCSTARGPGQRRGQAGDADDPRTTGDLAEGGRAVGSHGVEIAATLSAAGEVLHLEAHRSTRRIPRRATGYRRIALAWPLRDRQLGRSCPRKKNAYDVRWP